MSALAIRRPSDERMAAETYANANTHTHIAYIRFAVCCVGFQLTAEIVSSGNPDQGIDSARLHCRKNCQNDDDIYTTTHATTQLPKETQRKQDPNHYKTQLASWIPKTMPVEDWQMQRLISIGTYEKLPELHRLVIAKIYFGSNLANKTAIISLAFREIR